jgi:hypothetical protein
MLYKGRILHVRVSKADEAFWKTLKWVGGHPCVSLVAPPRKDVEVVLDKFFNGSLKRAETIDALMKAKGAIQWVRLYGAERERALRLKGKLEIAYKKRLEEQRAAEEKWVRDQVAKAIRTLVQNGVGLTDQQYELLEAHPNARLFRWTSKATLAR